VGGVATEQVGEGGGEFRAGKNLVAASGACRLLHVHLDVGDEAHHRDGAQRGVALELMDQGDGVGGGGVEVNNEHGGSGLSQPGGVEIGGADDLGFEAEWPGRVKDLGGEKEVVHDGDSFRHRYFPGAPWLTPAPTASVSSAPSR